jgi:hypothetical protein
MKSTSTATTTFLFFILMMMLTVSAKPLNKRQLKACYKKATLTQYWVPKEGDKDMLNDGKIVTLTGAKNKALKTTKGSTIAQVSQTTYEVSLLFLTTFAKHSLTTCKNRNFKWKVLAYLKAASWSI